jgi:alcohol dehydrogenase/L-iditol 2-dehydrogenase
LSILELVRRQLTLQGKLIYDHPRDFADTLSALDHGILPSRVIGARFTADDAAAAIGQALTVVGKTWIDLSAWHRAG